MNIFIVENSGAPCGYLQSILPDILGITVIGHAAAGERDVIERIETMLPDALIFGNPRGATAVGMLENIKKRHPTIKIMVLADCASELYFNRCKRVGVDHFLTAIHSSCVPGRLYGNGCTIAVRATILMLCAMSDRA